VGPAVPGRVIGDLQVATADPVTGEAITYRIGEDGAITGASHPGSVLSFLRPGQPWGDDVMTTFCHYVLRFTGPATAQRWTAAQPGTFVMRLGDAAGLARPPRRPAFGAGSARPGAAGSVRGPAACGCCWPRPEPWPGRARAGASCPADRCHAGHPVAPAGLRGGQWRQEAPEVRARQSRDSGTMTSP